jgi:hypothetical protein
VPAFCFTLRHRSQLQSRQKLRTIAAGIDDLVPANENLTVDPDYQPILFYVERKLIYVGNSMNFLTLIFPVQPELEHAALGRVAGAANQRLPQPRNHFDAAIGIVPGS